MINDRSAFLKHRKQLSFDLLDGTTKSIQIDLNIKTNTYFQILCLTDSMKSNDSNDNVFLLAEIVNEILQNTDQRIDTNWILNNVSQKSQVDIINYVCGYIEKELSSDIFKLPELEIEKNNIVPKNKNAQAHEEKKKKIQEYQEMLKHDTAITLMDDVVFIMRETANTYQDIMNMPIFVYRDIARNLALINARTNEDYNLAYLKDKAKRLQEEINNGEKVMIQPHKKRGADLGKLKALLG